MSDQNFIFTRLSEILTTVMPSKKSESYELFVDPNPAPIGGFLSKIYKCCYRNKDNGEMTYVAVKIVPVNIFKNTYRELHRNEVNFYQIIFPLLDRFQKNKGIKMPFVNIPRYLGGHITETDRFFIIEDLRAAGYQIHDKTQCYSSDHLKMVFKVYAKFHALSFVYKQEHPEGFNNIIGELVDVMKLEFNKRPSLTLEASFKEAIETFDSVLEADIIARLKKVNDIKGALENARNYNGKYKCLTHGDCFVTNIMFKYKPTGELEDAKLIDFQLSYVSTPVHDLSYFFYSGAAKADMDRVDYYLEFYYHHFSSFVRELGANPQEIYPFTALKSEWKKYSLIGIIIGIGMWVGKLMDKDEIISLIDRKNLPTENYYELWNSKMSEVRKGRAFRQRSRDICLHAIEYGIL